MADAAKIILTEGDAPATPAANTLPIYAKTDNLLYKKSSAGTEAEIYSAGGTDIPVADGGTGRSTGTTAYALVATGTTATGAQQTLAAAGATTQILVGGGVSALPVWGTDLPTAVTVGGAYITRVGGTDVIVADGGTGASTLADHGILLGSGIDAITPMTALGAGELVIGVAGADPHALAAGATTTVLVGGGAADPVWTTATGSGAPVRATSPVLVTPNIGTPSAGTLTSCTGLPLAGIVPGTAESDFIVAAATPFTRTNKTLAETRTILGLDGATTTIAVGGGTGVAPAWTTATGTGAPVRATSPTLVTPLLGTPTSGDLQNCTAATTTTKGVVELATVTEAVAGTDGTRPPGCDGLAAALAVVANPKAPSQAVALTAAASGSTGIVVANNANISFGTGNFALIWKGSLPDWTPGGVSLLYKYQSGVLRYALIVDSGGVVKLLLNGNSYTIITNTFVDGSSHELTAVILYGSTASLYVDGLLSTAAVSISAINTDNNGPLDISGLTATGECTAGTVIHAYTLNFAPTAAEVLDAFRNGIPERWKWGSQTERMPNQVDRDFSGASAWVNNTWNAYDETGDLTLAATAANQYCTLPVASAPTDIGKRYRLTFFCTTGGSRFYFMDFGGSQIIATPTVVAGTNSIEWVASTVGGLRLYSLDVNSADTFDNFSLTQLGATLALEPEGIQPAPGQWLDSSSNKLHAMQPATGSSLTRRMKEFEVRWTNTWAGTHEAQYIGGVNQAVLPVGCYITSIIGVVAGSTIEDIIIGDGSDTDHWVTITTGLAAGTTAFTVAIPTSDGTNYKLVVDPDANFTGSIAWTIRGIILQ